MIKVFLPLLFFSISLHAQEGRLIPNPLRNIPKWVRNDFFAQHLDERYTINYQLSPHILSGDFNHDGRKDVAIQVSESKSGKTGFIIFHRRRPQALITHIAIIGAGKSVGKGGDDFKWVNIWDARQRSDISDDAGNKALPAFDGAAIYVEKRDSTRGIIYWDGKKYSWYKLK
ncbi:MAG: hypothetical protein HY707_00775 [Ignavibacteriae bacterium]|nr:hypothetical protein [Ignavibacteriota bacterium]